MTPILSGSKPHTPKTRLSNHVVQYQSFSEETSGDKAANQKGDHIGRQREICKETSGETSQNRDRAGR